MSSKAIGNSAPFNTIFWTYQRIAPEALYLSVYPMHHLCKRNINLANLCLQSLQESTPLSTIISRRYIKNSPHIRLSSTGNLFRCTANCIRKKSIGYNGRSSDTMLRYGSLNTLRGDNMSGTGNLCVILLFVSLGIKYAGGRLSVIDDIGC